MRLEVIFIFIAIIVVYCKKVPKQYNYTKGGRKDEIWKPMMNESWINRFKLQFHPAWMDWCDPYHCNDYHKIVCGLNRKSNRFKWFQSGCHLVLHNMCAYYRGALKYDIVENRYCSLYVMFLRIGCPFVCPDVEDPICGISSIDEHVVLFRNRCDFQRRNCEGSVLEEYEQVNMGLCLHLL